MTTIDLQTITRSLLPDFAARAAAADLSGEFVSANYADLKKARVFSALVPVELGGGGATHGQVADFIRSVGQTCGSTALALAMHQHLVAAAVYKHRRGLPGKALLEKVAGTQAVLVSTGAKDWLESNGEMTRVEGGYRVTARKPFASGSPAGALFVTSARFQDPVTGPHVLHFGVPRSAPGVRVEEDWDTMGMRATGSNTVTFENVFVPDDAIALARPAGAYHPAWNVVLTVAMPLIIAAYVGVAEAAAERSLELAQKRAADQDVQMSVGEMINELRTAQLALRDMIALCNDFETNTTTEITAEILARKTIAARAIENTVDLALDVAGGFGFHRASGIERLVRDAHGVRFHPLTAKRQQTFTGRVTMGLDPIADPAVRPARIEAA